MFIKEGSTPEIRIGPFLDDGDGKTPEPSLSIGQADIRLSKNGLDFAQRNSSSPTNLTHDENGYYQLALNATDTNTVGRLDIAVSETGALPVLHHLYVVEENIYDALFAPGADAFDSNARVDVASIEGSDATDQINAACDAAFATYDGPTKAEMDSAFSTTNGKIDTVDDLVDTEVAAIKTVVDRIETDTQDIQSRIPASLVSGKIDASVSDVTSAGLNDIWTTDIVEAYAGASETACTPAELFYMILSCVGSYKIESDKIITLKLDDSTQAMRFDMDSTSSPTFRKRDG